MNIKLDKEQLDLIKDALEVFSQSIGPRPSERLKAAALRLTIKDQEENPEEPVWFVLKSSVFGYASSPVENGKPYTLCDTIKEAYRFTAKEVRDTFNSFPGDDKEWTSCPFVAIYIWNE